MIDLRVAMNRDRVIASLAHFLERGLERRQRFDRGLRAHMLVAVEPDYARLVEHGHHRAVEAAFVPRLGGAPLAFDRIAVDILAGVAVERRDKVGADPLRRVIMVEGERRIDHHRSSVGTERNPRHRFDSTPDRELRFARDDLGGGDVARLQPRGAEAVDLDPSGALVIARDQQSDSGDVAALLADRHDAAEDHIVDLAGVEGIAVANRPKRLRGKRQRGDFMKRAVGAPAPARGSNGIVDKGLRHAVSAVLEQLAMRDVFSGARRPSASSADTATSPALAASALE